MCKRRRSKYTSNSPMEREKTETYFARTPCFRGKIKLFALLNCEYNFGINSTVCSRLNADIWVIYWMCYNKCIFFLGMCLTGRVCVFFGFECVQVFRM